MSTGSLRLLAIITMAAAIGCTTPDAPLDQLSLRDALGARPDAIAALSIDARHALALRFIEAQDAEASLDATPAASANAPDPATVAAAVRAFDATRLQRGDDALVGLAHDSAVHALGGTTWIGASAAGLPALEGRDLASATAAIEAGALRGKAGRILAGAIADRNAKRLVRVTQWPAAVVVSGDVVYVNGTWLVALATLDDPALANPNDPTTQTMPPGLQPTPYTFCSVADNDESTERRLFWIAGPLGFVVWTGRRWKKRSERG